MSGQTVSIGREPPLQPYVAGEGRYACFTDILGIELADIQTRILRASGYDISPGSPTVYDSTLNSPE
jgi:hypothetical protein